MMLATWPEEVAGPIEREIHNVLTTTNTGALTLGAVFAVYFASSGVESLRIGLNRAYGMVEMRNWILLRLESIGYVLVGALGLLALGFLIVLGPLLFRAALRHAPWLEPLEGTSPSSASASPVVVLTVALFVAHKWLPAGRRRIHRDPARRRRDADPVAGRRHRFRPLSRRILVHLCEQLCRPRVGNDSAGVPVLDSVDLRLRRRTQRGDISAARQGRYRMGGCRLTDSRCRGGSHLTRLPVLRRPS